jgi:hypothetical protein
MRGLCILLVSGSSVLLLLSQSAVPAQAAWPHDPNVNVPLCAAPGDQYSPAIVADGSGGAIVAWHDYRSGSSYDIYAQRVSAAGLTQWKTDGVALCTATGDQRNATIVADGSGGAIVAWQDARGGAYDIYAQRVSAAGEEQWAPGGVALCTAAELQEYPTIVADGSGGAIVTWQDARGGAYDIYAQRVSAAGVAQWKADGVALCAATGHQYGPKSVEDASGGAIVTWCDYRNEIGSDYGIYVQRVSAAGVTQWMADGLALCTAANAQSDPTIAADGFGGAVVSWMDARSGVYDIYARRVNARGMAIWTADGVALCTAANNQQYPTVAPDGAGGAIVCWTDVRSGSFDIYAQRVDAVGVVQWAADGVALCAATGSQYSPTIIADASGGAVVTWYDGRSGATGADIYAQRVSTAGATLWTADGTALCTAPGEQSYPVIVPDGGAAGEVGAGAIVAWRDYRSGSDFDIHAQRIETFGYLGSPEPVIASVGDVPNDQGGAVKLSWLPSWLDAAYDTNLVAYDVLRSVPSSAARVTLANGRRLLTLGGRAESPAPGDIVAQTLGSQTYYWEYLASVPPLHYAEGYSLVAPTTGDSIAGSNPFTLFMVVGRDAGSTMYWSSSPDSGYSVDNLPPATPEPFSGQYAAGTAILFWGVNDEADLGGYRLYRGTTADFVPGAGNLVVEQPDTGYVDVAGAPYWYKLSAVDVHGNESGHAVVLPTGVTGVGEPAAAALSLALGSTNPGRAGAALRWTLPVEGEVRLLVHDVAGRVVRELVAGWRAAGVHATTWDGRDDAGAAVASGLYLARLEAGGRGVNVRFALVR